MTSTLLHLLPKIRRRVPAMVGQSRWMNALEDRIAAKSFFKSKDVKQLKARQLQCRTPEDYFDFASELFPSHQLRSEITRFLEFAALENPRIVAEIGTAEGGTNFLLGQALPSTEWILGIDLFVKNIALLREFNSREIEQSFVFGSSYSAKTVERFGTLLSGRKLDLLFVDGDHTYAGVQKDFLYYRDFVREGGLIAFHDIVPDFLTRHGQPTGRWAGDVPAFWANIRDAYDHWEFIENREQDGFGIGVIRYDQERSRNLHL